MIEDPKIPSHSDDRDDITLSYSDNPMPARPGLGVPASDVPPNAVFAPGQILAGRFHVIRFVARGGMGEVYEAEDLELNERVAVKTARFEASAGAHEIERFRREIQLARRVTHPNVCRTFDVFRHTSGLSDFGVTTETLLVSMELLAGATLNNQIRRKRMTTAEAMPIVTQMCAGLGAAHAVGVIHRDFKSSNVMLVPSSSSGQHGSSQATPPGSASLRVVITDFGLAHAEEHHHGYTLTRTGDIVGTPAYMAPEQIEGGLITPATDIYSLGIVIYEMLSGALPFVGDTPLATAIKRLRAPAPSLLLSVPDLDGNWAAVVERCLAVEPLQRFGNTEEILSALRGNTALPPASAVTNTVLSTSIPSGIVSSIKTSSSIRWILVLAVVTALAAGSAWFLIRQRTEKNAAALSSQAAATGARKSVAILGFSNMSGRKDADPLGNFLVDSLWSQLDTGQLRFVPPARVEEMKQNISSINNFARLSGEQVQAVHQFLGADILVTGSYNVDGLDGPSSEQRVQLNIHLLDGANGQHLVSLTTPSVPRSDLNDLVVHAGSLIRSQFDIKLKPYEEARLNASLSANTDAVTAFSEAQQQLRTFNLGSAIRLLEKSVEADPQFAQAHAALAEAWDSLGFESKAADEAKKALDSSRNLSTEARDLIGARYAASNRDWTQAIPKYAQLWTQYRDEPEYGLLLANAQLRAGKPKDALNTIAQVRSQNPPPGVSAQLDLTQAQAHDTLGDPQLALASATSAALTAQSMKANLLLARARISQCIAYVGMGEPTKATPLCAEAKKINLAAGDQLGAARATNQIAKAYYNSGNYTEAGTLFEEALGIAQSIGDKYDEAGALNNLGNIQSSRGDNSGAEKSYEQSIAVAQERGEKGDAAMARQNLATVLYSAGQAARAEQMFDAATKTARDIGDNNLQAMIANNQCAYELSYGAVLKARKACEVSLQIRRTINNRADIGKTLSSYAVVLLQQDELDAATSAVRESISNLVAVGAKNDAAWAQITSAQLALERGNFEEAKKTATDASDELAREKDSGGEAEARITLTSALLGLKDFAAAREQADRVSVLAAQAGDKGVTFDARIATARVDVQSGKTDDAIKSLTAIQKEARSAGLVQIGFDAKLALGDAQLASGKKKDGTATLRALEAEAKAHSFTLVARKAAARVPA
jgi:serine/threonine protein kinase/tetratricopeptide (TPR) repeat protein